MTHYRRIALVTSIVPACSWGHGFGEDIYVTVLAAPFWLALWTLLVAVAQLKDPYVRHPVRDGAVCFALTFLVYGTLAFICANLFGAASLATLAYVSAAIAGAAAFGMMRFVRVAEVQRASSVSGSNAA